MKILYTVKFITEKTNTVFFGAQISASLEKIAISVKGLLAHVRFWLFGYDLGPEKYFY